VQVHDIQILDHCARDSLSSSDINSSADNDDDDDDDDDDELLLFATVCTRRGVDFDDFDAAADTDSAASATPCLRLCSARMRCSTVSALTNL
jgi:hypothetical protein